MSECESELNGEARGSVDRGGAAAAPLAGDVPLRDLIDPQVRPGELYRPLEDVLRDAAQFIHSLSPDVPWQVTPIQKDYKMTDPDNTGAGTLVRAAEIGYEEGRHFVCESSLPGRV